MNLNMGKLVLIIFGALFVASNLVNPVEPQKSLKRRVKFCRIETLVQLCGVEPNLMFTSTEFGSGIPKGDAEMEQYCFNIVDVFPACARKWFAKCASPVHTDFVFKVFLNQSREAMKLFCDPNGHIRNEFVKYSSCLIHDVKLAKSYRKHCVRPLQAAGEWIHNRARAEYKPNITELVRDNCCAYNKWEACILDHLTRNCGKPSADVFPYLIDQTSMNAVKYMCKHLKYDHEDPKSCDKSRYIAPEHYMPKGLHSHSIMSYVFSYACPNVGWGVVPERDF